MAWQRVERPEDVASTFPREAPQTRIRPELEPLPDEAVFDKISFSALEGTLLNMARRNLGLESFAIVGVATEIGVEPTVRHATDLGYVPVVISDTCGAVNEEAGRRALAVLEHAGDAMFTDTVTISRLLREGGRATD
jgi:nicotinamidase-related amidase